MNEVLKYLGNNTKGLRKNGIYAIVKYSKNGLPVVINDVLELVEVSDFKNVTTLHDDVENPEHYVSENIACIDAMEAGLGVDVAKDFCIGNAFKYIWRHKKKNDPIKDIKKATKYLKMYIEFLKREDDNDA